MNLSKHNIAYFLLIMIFLISGCGGGSTSSATEETSTNTANATAPTTTAPTTTAPTTTAPTAKAVQSGQVKDSSTGSGLANVKVSIGSVSTTTDAEGYYSFSDLTASEEAVVNFEKEGYLLGSKKIQLKSLSGDQSSSSNYLDYNMYTYDYQWDHESSKEFAGGAISIDASYLDTKGNPYNGTIAAKLTVLNNNEEELLKAFPGAFKGINNNGTLVQFETYGLISISLQDSHGNELSFAKGETGTLIFNQVSSSEKPDTLPLWYYDKKQGLWIEEGYAELQDDGSYKGDITHLGIWSLNKAIETDPGIYRGRILSEDGSPMSDVRLYAIGDNWISSDLSTDQDGFFEIEVNPGSSFRLSAYDYKNKYGANYNGTIPAIASGEIVED